jgi:hypothetical protein
VGIVANWALRLIDVRSSLLGVKDSDIVWVYHVPTTTQTRPSTVPLTLNPFALDSSVGSGSVVGADVPATFGMRLLGELNAIVCLTRREVRVYAC